MDATKTTPPPPHLYKNNPICIKSNQIYRNLYTPVQESPYLYMLKFCPTYTGTNQPLHTARVLEIFQSCRQDR